MNKQKNIDLSNVVAVTRSSVLTVFALILIGLSAHAQKDGLPKDSTSFEFKNAYYVEGVGRCPLYSLNYERTIVRIQALDLHIGMNVGGAFHQIHYEFGVYAPGGVFFTYGRNNKKVQLGLGVVMVIPVGSEDGAEMWQYYTTSVAYRYVFKNSNFMQISGVLQLSEDFGTINPTIGVTVGKLFGKRGLRSMEGPQYAR